MSLTPTHLRFTNANPRPRRRAADTAASAHQKAEYDTAVAACAGHNIPISTVVGSWETQDEHCGTAASIAAGNGGTLADNSVNIDSNVGSGSEIQAPSMLLMVVLAVMSL